ncbi:MAG: hypothetical protein JWN96_464 [Mycobacterium sp.]|nr:hypothetical protein [Mycobacterium sp.]
MRRTISSTLLGGGCLLMVCGVVGCGAPIITNHDWLANVSVSSYQQKVNYPPTPTTSYGVLYHWVLDGGVLNNDGQKVSGSQFREDCSYPLSSSSARIPMRCALVLEVGHKTYTAAGSSLTGLFSILKSTAKNDPGVSISVAELKMTKQDGADHYLVKISLRTDRR